MRRLEWIQTGSSLNTGDSTAQPVGKIVESVWLPTNSTPPYTYPSQSSPTRTRTIATDVEHVRNANGTIAPIFQYYGNTVSGGVGRRARRRTPSSRRRRRP